MPSVREKLGDFATGVKYSRSPRATASATARITTASIASGEAGATPRLARSMVARRAARRPSVNRCRPNVAPRVAQTRAARSSAAPRDAPTSSTSVSRGASHRNASAAERRCGLRGETTNRSTCPSCLCGGVLSSVVASGRGCGNAGAGAAVDGHASRNVGPHENRETFVNQAWLNDDQHETCRLFVLPCRLRTAVEEGETSETSRGSKCASAWSRVSACPWSSRWCQTSLEMFRSFMVWRSHCDCTSWIDWMCNDHPKWICRPWE